MLYFFSQVSVFSGFSQKAEAVFEDLEWKGIYSMNINGVDSKKVFHSSNGYWDFENDQPYLLKYIPIYNTAANFNVTNIQVIPLTSSEIALLDVSRIKPIFDFKTNITDKRKSFMQSLKLMRFGKIRHLDSWKSW